MSVLVISAYIFRVVMVCKLSLKQSNLCACFRMTVIIFAGSIC